MANFEGKNILIVGASSGIGYDLAGKLIESGANVYSASRNKPEDLEVKAHFNLDVTNISGDELKELPKELHGFAYCPGTINLKPFNRLKDSDLRNDFEINVVGAFKVIQAVLTNLKKAKGGQIVLFSTVAVNSGMNFHASISAAKGALEGLAKSLAAELAGNQVCVNVIAPSLTNTPLASKLLSSEDKQEASAKRHPIGRVGTTNDMASTAKFLLSEDASWITGQVLGVDGGMSALRLL
jgi:3-oxoacyl-[acyl-carrier protein] reductase